LPIDSPHANKPRKQLVVLVLSTAPLIILIRQCTGQTATRPPQQVPLLRPPPHPLSPPQSPPPPPPPQPRPTKAASHTKRRLRARGQAARLVAIEKSSVARRSRSATTVCAQTMSVQDMPPPQSSTQGELHGNCSERVRRQPTPRVPNNPSSIPHPSSDKTKDFFRIQRDNRPTRPPNSKHNNAHPAHQL
jgi:hypothetical protein